MKNKNKFISILIFLLSIVIIYSAYNTVINYIEQKQVKEEIRVINVSSLSLKTNNKNVIEKAKEDYQNNDIVGHLKIEGTGIDTLLVQTDNNDYYLSHLINKEYNKTGSVFVDYRTNIDNDKQVNIYGHSSGIYDIPFNNLKKYLDKDFLKKNKIITIETTKDTYKYEIYSVKITDNEEHLNINFNEEDYKKHLYKMKKDSLYEENITFSSNDEILVLQTCIFNNPKGSLLIINSRKVG